MQDLDSLPALFCMLAGCVAVTLLPRVIPLYVFSKKTPDWLRTWLNYIPAAVMAALVVPDLFFYGGSFNANPFDNLFLLAGLASVIFCLVTSNFVGTIIFGMAFVALARYFGIGA